MGPSWSWGRHLKRNTSQDGRPSWRWAISEMGGAHPGDGHPEMGGAHRGDASLPKCSKRVATHPLMRYSQRGTRAHGCAAAERSAGASPGRACVEPERLGARAAGGRASVGGSWASRGARQADGPRAGSGRSSSGQASWRQRAVLSGRRPRRGRQRARAASAAYRRCRAPRRRHAPASAATSSASRCSRRSARPRPPGGTSR